MEKVTFKTMVFTLQNHLCMWQNKGLRAKPWYWLQIKNEADLSLALGILQAVNSIVLHCVGGNIWQKMQYLGPVDVAFIA